MMKLIGRLALAALLSFGAAGAAVAQVVGGNTSVSSTSPTQGRVTLPANTVTYPSTLLTPAPGTTVPVYYKFGTTAAPATATSASPVLPVGGICLNIGPNANVSVLADSGSVKVNVTQLSVCPLFSGNGGGGGAPSGAAGGDLAGTYPNPTLAWISRGASQTLNIGPGGTLVATAFSTDAANLTGTVACARLPALTGDVTTSAGSCATTLASVIVAGGPTGSATVAPIITYDAKGRLTAVSTATITPAVGSITGLGSGVATALGNTAGGAGGFALVGSTPPTGAAGGELAGTYPNPTLVNSAVIGKVLTGYVSGAGTVAATDSILQAIQKLNGNTAALVTGVSSVSNSDTTLTISPTTGAVVASLNLAKANTWTAAQVINLNAGSAPAMISGGGLQVVGADSTIGRVTADSFGAIAAFTVRRANGTGASPTAIVSGDQLGGFNSYGYRTSGGTGYSGPSSSVQSFATENWTSTANGTKVVIATTPNLSTTLTTALTIDQDQSATLVGRLTAAGLTNNVAGAASLPSEWLTGALFTGGTATTTFPQIFIQPTGTTAATTWSTSGTIIGANVVSGFAGNFLDFRIAGGGSFFNVTSGGAIGFLGNLNAANTSVFAFGSRGLLTSSAAGTINLGAADVDTNAAIVSQTLRSQGALTGGTADQAGKNLTLIVSPGKGTGAGGSFIVQTAPAGSTGTAVNAPVTALTIDSTGVLTIPKAIAQGGNTAGYALGVRASTNLNFQVRPLNTSVTIQSANDANSASVAMELLASTLNISNDAGGALVTFGGTTSSFPALKRSTVGLTFRLADDSADTTINASTITLSALAQTSAAQSGTVCYNTSGVVTYDATLGCLTSTITEKDDWKDFTPEQALAIVLRMQAGSFTYKKGRGLPAGEQIGLSAEQVGGIDDRLVAHRPNGDLAGVRYQQASALYPMAIQQLKADNDNLRAELRDLQRRVAR